MNVTFSVLFPGELADWKQGEPQAVQCGSEGTITVLLRPHHELVKFELNGAVQERIDVSGLAGLGEAGVVSYAAGPQGKTYVLDSHVTFFEVKRSELNKPP